MRKAFRLLLVIFVAFVSLVSPVSAEQINTNVSEENAVSYNVLEDAFIRDAGNADKNYNHEEIGKSHGAQYEGKGIKVVNVKSSNIIAVQKYDLPKKEEVEKHGFNKYEFEFNIFKNPDYNNGDQVYSVNYSTDTTWDETSITWNNRPTDIKLESNQVLTTFDVPKGIEYEKMEDKDKKIRLDITEGIKKLVEEGHSQITIFLTAKHTLNTSLMYHSKETSDQNKVSKIIASKISVDRTELETLVTMCSNVKESEYSRDSYQLMKEKLAQAKAVLQNSSATDAEILIAYQALQSAYDTLDLVVNTEDKDNVAFNKPTRGNLSKDQTSLVNDGDMTTTWTGKFYPSYIDIDLMDTYDISEFLLYFPENKVIYYTLYGSNDGKNFDEIYQNRSDQKKTKEGDVLQAPEVCNYRIVRVYFEYTEGDAKSYLSEIRVHGEKTDSNTAELRKGSLEDITGIEAYNKTKYAQAITQNEIIENVYGIIDRTIGTEYRNWFSFEIVENGNKETGYDYFELSDKDGKVHIKGNEGLSLATGLNFYYKNYVNVQISEQTMQVKMPKSIVSIGNTVRKESPMKVRYAFNYCTLSYTFAFFGEEEWQRENDWLALNGVNVVLDLAGQEATWIKFLMNFGYSYDDAKDWLTGPGYYAWQFMDNMEVFGGPIPDGYVIDRVELARSTQRWKNSLGMQTVLQGYAGMVPTNFKDFYKGEVEIISQGSWNGFARPDMIATDSDAYDDFATKFYEAQEFVYGNTSDYYAVDPFHEGGKRPSGLTDEKISKEVLESMLKYDKDAIWTVQGWQSNPTNGLLKGMGDLRKDHVLIVDLIKYPIEANLNYKKTNYTNPALESVEFNGTNWAWCLLGNFGGNPTMNGQLETMVNEIQKAKKESKHMVGLGVISEATYDNPMVYDLLFDLAWADEDFDLSIWKNKYIERRYGGTSANAKTAWNLITDSNYDYGVRLTEEILGLRTGGVPSKLGKKNIGYDTKNLENALRLLIEDFDKFKESEAYRYDLTEIMRQVSSNYITLKYHDVLDARNNKDLDAFKEAKREFLNAFDVLNKVQETQQDQLAGEWIGKAEDRAASYDDFSKSTFKMNAKSLISTWGSAGGALIDYGFRTYEGLFNDIIKSRWVEYLDQVENNLQNGTAITTPSSASGYIPLYWKWVISDQKYTRSAKSKPEDLQSVATRVLNECVFTGELDPNIGNTAYNRKVRNKGIIVEGKNKYATDGMLDDVVSVKGKDAGLIIDLVGEFQLSKVQVVLDGKDDAYYHYELYSSTDGKEWKSIAKKQNNDIATQEGISHEIKNAAGRYIKIVAIKDNVNKELRIKEIRTFGERKLPELEALQSIVDYATTLEKGSSSDNDFDQLQKSLEKAREALKETSPDAVNVAYWGLYDAIIRLNISDIQNVALNKPTEASNDPSGVSKNLVDGSLSTSWNSGRLSVPGQPYDHGNLIPGTNTIDLKDVYNISELRISFGNKNIWYNYEIHGSLDGKEWTKLAEKTNQATPNDKDDVHTIDVGQYRYIKLVTTNVQNESDIRRNSYSVTELQVMGFKVADMQKLQAMIDEVKAYDETMYTVESWRLFAETFKQANDLLAYMEASQEDVDQILLDVTNAKNQLVYKDADYTNVDKAIATSKKLDKNAYKDFSEVEKAINAIVRNLNITEQTRVDEMAKAIQKEINALIYKDADYTNVDKAIATSKKLDKNAYKDFSEVEKAINSVVRDLNITEQERVDAMAKSIYDAIAALIQKPIEPINPETPDNGGSHDNESDKKDNPTTGDTTSDLRMLSMLMLLPAAIIAIVLRKRYVHKKM